MIHSRRLAITSLCLSLNQTTAAKIIIYEGGKERINGSDPHLEDGVYVWIRTAHESQSHTIRSAPSHDGRYAYFRLNSDQNLDETADFIQDVTDIDMQ